MYNLSYRALSRLLEKVEKEGYSLEAAKQALGYEGWRQQEARYRYVPPVREHLGNSLRNPLVERCLSEVRRVVNELIEQCGPFDEIRVKLARELAQLRQQRAALQRQKLGLMQRLLSGYLRFPEFAPAAPAPNASSERD